MIDTRDGAIKADMDISKDSIGFMINNRGAFLHIPDSWNEMSSYVVKLNDQYLYGPKSFILQEFKSMGIQVREWIEDRG